MERWFGCDFVTAIKMDFIPEMPNGRLPVLEVNGQKLSESHAILRFLANKFGLAGKTELEQLKIDEIVDLHKDFTNEVF